MILDIYKDSFEYSSRKLSNLILLGILSFLNFLIIPMVFFYGYNYRVVKESTFSMINGEDVPPEFTNLSGMFVDGLKYIVVYLAYLIIPIALLYAGIYYNIWILSLIAIILLFVAILFAFIAIPHMAANDDSLSSAFAVPKLNEVISSIGYGRYILAYIGIAFIYVVIFLAAFIVLSIIFGILGIATLSIFSNGAGAFSLIAQIIINIILFFIIMPYLSVFQSRCQGLIYNLRG